MSLTPQSVAGAQVQTFLAELVNGTRGYEQIRSLEGQVGREYRGRVVYELLQNAHDALPLPGEDARTRRIRFVLDADALLVANDGHQVSDDDLRSLCEMALSTKDPAESIGNKGVGFRSTLDVSDAPEVYSHRSGDAPGTPFRGHSFRFSPPTLAALRDAVAAFVSGDDPRSPYSEGPLVPARDVDRLRSALRHREAAERAAGRPWTAAGQTAYLSPYALPVALADVPSSVANLAAEGFATVVRLPLRTPDDAQAVRSQIQALADPTTLLFLDRVGALQTVVDGVSVSFERAVTGTAPGGAVAVAVRERGGDVSDHVFWVWSHTLGGDSDPEAAARLHEAIRASRLPSAWDSVGEARISLAVEAAAHPRPGRYSVFLPTTVPTGSGAFLNAPFSASLNRGSVDAALPLNALLVAGATALAAQAVRGLAAADAGDAVAAAVRLALVAPAPERPVEALDASRLVRVALGDVARIALVGTDAGWATPAAARIAEYPGFAQVLTPTLVQRASPVPAVHAHLAGPFEALARVLRTRHGPSLAERIRIVEAAVAAVDPDAVDWNALVADLEALFPDARDLAGARVLLADDDTLVAPTGPPALFFPPQRDASALAVPEALRDRVAFLSPRVRLQTGGQAGTTTPAREYLRHVVQEYAQDRLLRDVVRPAVPRARLALGSPDARQWATVLRWAVPLVVQDTPQRDLNAYLVPCRGGWLPAGEAAFGPGWDDAGQDLDRYLRAAKLAGSETAAHARDRLVLPPDHPEWEGSPLARADLARLGVAAGLRLLLTPYDEDVRLSSTYAYVPDAPPHGVSADQWTVARGALYERLEEEGGFVTTKLYRLGPLWTVPGLDAFAGLQAPTLQRLTRLVAASVATWPDDGDTSVPSFRRSWRNVVVNKPDGDRHRFVVASPLAVLLEHLAWVATDGDAPAPPSARWILPAAADRDARRYAYLRPLPTALLAHDGATDAFEALGSGRLYDAAPSPDAPRFLDAVADALSAGSVDDRTARAHARDGWDHLDRGTAARPRRVVCHDHTGSITAVDARAAGAPVFFPDGDEGVTDVLLQQGHRVVVVDPATARTLALPAGYAGVRPTSSLDAHVLVAGAPWNAARALALPALPSEWLAEVALSASAFGGSGQGVQTAAFAAAAATLQRARLVVVDGLETVLTAGADTLSAPVQADAQWDAAASTLLLARGAPLHALVDPLQSLLGRRDLHAPLRLVLGALAADGHAAENPPDADAVSRALATMRVGDDRLDTVRRFLRGDLSLTRDRALAVTALLAPDALPALADDGSEPSIRAALARGASDAASASYLWELCQTVRSDETLGEALHAQLGDQAELDVWNAALARLDRPPVRSAAAPAEALAHVRAALPLARAVVRHALVQDGRLADYDAVAPPLVTAAPPDGLDLVFWSPPFAASIVALVQTLRDAGSVGPETDVLASARTPADARAALLDLGVDVVDPDATREENARLATTAAGTLALMADALGLPTDPFPDAARSALSAQGTATLWTDAEALRLVASHVPASTALDALLAAASDAASLDDLLGALGLTRAALDAARNDADRRADDARRSTRTLSVGGRPFDASHPEHLWDHLALTLTDDLLPPADLDALAPLKTPPKKRAATSTSPTTKRASAGKGRGDGPQWKKDLVGDAGEMVVFRALRRQYGPETVRPEAWCSSAREDHYPGVDGDDTLGYDIAFDQDGTRYLVEVKSTVGDGTTFTMGSSEVREAKRAARAKGVVYRIARVDDALGTPRLSFLPNPYERPDLYRIEAQDALVTFRRDG